MLTALISGNAFLVFYLQGFASKYRDDPGYPIFRTLLVVNNVIHFVLMHSHLLLGWAGTELAPNSSITE